MSENHAGYRTENKTIKTLDMLKTRACALPYANPNYKPPSPDEISALIELAGWSQVETAKLVGVTYNPKKGSTTVRKWKAPIESKEHRPINYASWRLLLLYAGVVTIEEGKIT